MVTYVAHPEAVARVPRSLAFRYDALALNLVDGTLSSRCPIPMTRTVIDALRAATRLRVRALPMAREAIREQLRAAYGEAAPCERVAGATRRPCARSTRFSRARSPRHASDVHVEPRSGGGGHVRLRIDGVLRELETIPADLFARVQSRA